MMYSIITVVLNEKELLKKTIRSVLTQSYSDYEFIIIDGKSTDGTMELIQEAAAQNESIRYISEKDNGIYDAMNKGIALAKGEYILFMGAGDTFYHEHVLQQVAFHKGYDVIYGYGFFSSGKEKGKQIGAKMTKWNILLDRCVAHQATYVKTSLMKQYGFNVKYKAYADQDFLIHMYRDKKTFYYMNEPLCYYDGTGFSSQEDNREKYLDDHLLIMKEYFYGLYLVRRFGRMLKHCI